MDFPKFFLAVIFAFCIISNQIEESVSQQERTTLFNGIHLQVRTMVLWIDIYYTAFFNLLLNYYRLQEDLSFEQLQA